ncbi:MAG: restriction endonuclease subunit S [Chlorobi bacterium]|nr:restriction endonuclease subunit S [Chlorobiota bacterium]
MNYIEQMVAELCPNGVEFKMLEELGTTYAGLTGKSKADFSNGNARFASYKNIFNNLALDLEASDFVRVEAGEKQNAVTMGDVLFTGSSETPGEVGMSSVIVERPSEAIYLNSFCFGYRFNDDGLLLPGFSKYLFRSEAVRQQIVLSASGVTRFNISKKRFLNTRIPLPPLPIQQEIVRVLDTFSQLVRELQANLQAELVARRKQYQYYRDQLLSFEGRKDVRWGTLGEMFDMRAGHHISAQNIIAEPDQSHLYPCFGGNGVRGFVEKFSHDGAYLLIGRQGALCGNVQRARGKFYATEHAVVVTASAEINVDWAFHMLTLMNLNQYASKSAQPGLAVGKLAELRIAVPPLAEQEEIAGILDKFDALVNDLSIGLPAEIAARQKQYEYYRDRLLTFPEAAPQEVAAPMNRG